MMKSAAFALSNISKRSTVAQRSCAFFFSEKVSNATTTSTRNLNVVARPSDLIGNTPLIDLEDILKNHGVDTSNGVKLVGKLESLGPCSSVKDRLGRSLIDEAEAKGLITPGKTVLVEPSK